MSQKQKILTALKNGRRLTHLDAIKDFGCARLAARVNELRQAGHSISSAMVKKGNKSYSAYWMERL